MTRSVFALIFAVAVSACAVSVRPEPARAAFETQATSAWLYDVETDTVLFEKPVGYSETACVDVEADDALHGFRGAQRRADHA